MYTTAARFLAHEVNIKFPLFLKYNRNKQVVFENKNIIDISIPNLNIHKSV